MGISIEGFYSWTMYLWGAGILEPILLNCATFALQNKIY